VSCTSEDHEARTEAPEEAAAKEEAATDKARTEDEVRTEDEALDAPKVQGSILQNSISAENFARKFYISMFGTNFHPIIIYINY
jgi:hypothetical protein